jgi:hypothetical protein
MGTSTLADRAMVARGAVVLSALGRGLKFSSLGLGLGINRTVIAVYNNNLKGYPLVEIALRIVRDGG